MLSLPSCGQSFITVREGLDHQTRGWSAVLSGGNPGGGLLSTVERGVVELT